MNEVSEETAVEGCILRWNGVRADSWRDGSAVAEVERERVWVNLGGAVSFAAEYDA